MKAVQFITLDGRTLREPRPIGRLRRERGWVPAAILALALVLLVAAAPPRLADICDQQGQPLACGP